jgi:pyridinium-3,5-biscarboxylic acid mononucleotide sulfurtransferase
MSYTVSRNEMESLPANQESVKTAGEAAALQKQDSLFRSLQDTDSMLVAFSGGADSAYLAWAAHKMLGGKALAITAVSSSLSRYDREQAESFARWSGLRHEFIETHEFENPLYVMNGADRCYHCKDELFKRMEELAQERNVRAIAYGINADDTHDFRPGHRAAHEHRILAPLLDAKLRKEEIRLLSRCAGLPTSDKPASACLSSRIAYGTPVTPEILGKVERAEAVLRQLGFRQFRVRAHGELARIELGPEELARGFEPGIAREIAECLNDIGFAFVTLDLEGYRRGSLNSLLGAK